MCETEGMISLLDHLTDQEFFFILEIQHMISN